MSKTIVGVQERKGVYEGSPYHNVLFHCTEPFEEDDNSSAEVKVTGVRVKVFKVKVKNLDSCFEKPTTIEQTLKLLGSQASFHHDDFQNVNLIRVHQPTPAPTPPQPAPKSTKA